MRTIKSKYILTATLFAAIAFFASCNKWLDVSPKTQIKEEVQFSNSQGFTDALFGVYQKAATVDGYGRNMSFGALDMFAQQYSGLTNGPYNAIVRYQYRDSIAQKRVDAMFSNTYSAIAQANYLLKNVGNGVLDESTLKIVEGEALGMRAFLHFDLVRLFADTYNEGANASTNSLAYMREYKVSPENRIPLKDYLDLCETDLKKAEELLSSNQNIDQIAFNQGSTSADLFLMFRQNHLNYWAVKATLARLYQYKGDKPNALKYALEVIQGGKFSFINPATLVVDQTSDQSDLTFTPEHIFSFYVSELKKLADESFKIANSTVVNIDITDFYTTRSSLESTFQATLPGYGTDIRKVGASRSIWNEINASIVYTKKYYSDKSTNVKQRLIPAIRLPEMYYIAAEASPSLAEGTVYLNEVRKRRLIPEIAVPATQALFDAEIMAEYRKEFYAEGQLWYYYKRKNIINIPNGSANPLTREKYVLPLPNGELEFGSSGVN
ncbi:RagB/SusD family nutrient uptake outer membrane protein [Pedobacter psychroterrae]|uniref:RagB/SusD family nutrient uptake outer membrane protein n=1 Tax=Pedobacter psychroterrae TaxID=2530453 RepID=A0A4R0NCU1_9SPHI|nr:RagB/SusD family nutrient uptake outer membrane protein [Pedobacter psychroterrae]TCC98161.1 RagB/SusD family nutrient uptake outer membrane protein [Pedobacter psychroterrae]